MFMAYANYTILTLKLVVTLIFISILYKPVNTIWIGCDSRKACFLNACCCIVIYRSISLNSVNQQ